MRQPVLIDGKRTLDRAALKSAGYVVERIGDGA
jgi:hypothetical protein